MAKKRRKVNSNKPLYLFNLISKGLNISLEETDKQFNFKEDEYEGWSGIVHRKTKVILKVSDSWDKRSVKDYPIFSISHWKRRRPSQERYWLMLDSCQDEKKAIEVLKLCIEGNEPTLKCSWCKKKDRIARSKYCRVCSFRAEEAKMSGDAEWVTSCSPPPSYKPQAITPRTSKTPEPPPSSKLRAFSFPSNNELPADYPYCLDCGMLLSQVGQTSCGCRTRLPRIVIPF